MIESIITIDPEIVSGTPVFQNTRVPTQSLFDYISTGESIDSYLEDFPYVSRMQVNKVLKIAGELLMRTAQTSAHENTN